MNPRRTSRTAPGLGLIALGLLLLGGFTATLQQRYSTGEIYPPYSTLRSDPLGSRVLHDSLASLPGLTVSRNLRPLQSLRTLDTDSALWLGGLPVDSLQQLHAPEDSPILAAIRDEGARLIITIDPQSSGKLGNPGAITSEKTGDDDESTGERLTELLGVRLVAATGIAADENTLKPGDNAPGELPGWRGLLRFAELDESWHVIARAGDEPVIIQRALGTGTVVMAADSYFASNEALWRGAHPGFLLWMIGGKTRLVFDETLHGSVESGGAMKMIRRYRFHGFLIGLVILVALLAWRGDASLTPASEALESGLGSGGAVIGEETASGLERLLRRNIPPRRLLRVCVEVWRDTAGRRHRTGNESQRQAVEALLSEHERNPRQLSAAAAFQQIHRLLSRPH